MEEDNKMTIEEIKHAREQLLTKGIEIKFSKMTYSVYVNGIPKAAFVGWSPGWALRMAIKEGFRLAEELK
jgi:hypothetical protein